MFIYNLLSLFLVSWVAYIAFIYSWSRFKSVKFHIPLGVLIVPTSVAISMGYIFVVLKGETVAQFTVHSKQAGDIWSLWVSLFMAFYFITLISAGTCLIFAVIAALNRNTLWTTAPIYLISSLMSLFAFFTVVSKAPTA